MFCQKPQPHPSLCCIWTVLPIVGAAILIVLYFKKTRSGKCMLQKAERIKDGVEDAVCTELGKESPSA